MCSKGIPFTAGENNHVRSVARATQFPLRVGASNGDPLGFHRKPPHSLGVATFTGIRRDDRWNPPCLTPSLFVTASPSTGSRPSRSCSITRSQIPDNWHVLCVFLEASVRPPRPATVLLNYRSADGHESVSLSESSATDRTSGYGQLTSSDVWQDVERDGTVVRVTKTEALGSQAQAHLERDGTFVVLTSETLNSDQLANLKPAPTAGSIQ